MQHMLGKRMEQSTVLTAANNRRVIVQTEYHSGQQRKYQILEANAFAFVCFKRQDWIAGERFECFGKWCRIIVRFPNENVHIDAERCRMRCICMQRSVQIEKVTKMVIHIGRCVCK